MYIILFITFQAGLSPSNDMFTRIVETAGRLCTLFWAWLDFIAAKKC